MTIPSDHPSVTFAADGRRAATPAWLMSLVVHLLFLLLVLLTWKAPQAFSLNEPERTGGIVLIQQDANDQPSYYSDSNDPSRPGAELASDSSRADSQSASDAALAALPVDQAAEFDGSIQLPERGDAPSPLEGLLQSASMAGAGRGRLPSSTDIAAVLAEDAARLTRAEKGELRQLSIFGSPAAVGRSFVFLIDRSKSMGGTGLNALAAAEQQLGVALQDLQDEHLFQVVAYNERSHYLGERQMQPATAENKARLAPYFASLSAIGRTDHELALQSVLRLQPDVIFMLSDGGEPGLTEGQHRALQRLAASRTTIHGIQFGFGPLQEAYPFMRRLAESTGGSFTYVDMIGY